MTIKKQVLLTIYDQLLAAESATLTIIQNQEYQDLNTTSAELASLEGNIERISSILADIRTNHTG